ncbi:hypothetical protein D037_0243B, partial [Vibrio parahaemolyticus IDH02640]
AIRDELRTQFFYFITLLSRKLEFQILSMLVHRRF